MSNTAIYSQSSFTTRNRSHSVLKALAALGASAALVCSAGTASAQSRDQGVSSTDASKAKSLLTPGTFKLALKAGLASGSETKKTLCDGPACPTEESDKVRFEQDNNLRLDGELLYNISPSFRIGAGLFWASSQELTKSGTNGSFEQGSSLGLDFLIVETVLPINSKLALSARAQLGAVAWLGSKDISNMENRMEKLCEDNDVECSISQAPYPGGEGAIGAGLLFRAGQNLARLDFQVQTYTVYMPWMEVNGTKVQDNYRGTRFLISGGIEL